MLFSPIPSMIDPEDKPAEEAMREIRSLFNNYLLGASGTQSLFNHIEDALKIEGVQQNAAFLKECHSMMMERQEKISYYKNPSNAGVWKAVFWGQTPSSAEAQSARIISRLAELRTALDSNKELSYQEADSYKQELKTNKRQGKTG